MKCEIRPVAFSDDGDLDVKFRLTQEELVVLKNTLVNAKKYGGATYTDDNLAIVILAAMDRAEIKG